MSREPRWVRDALLERRKQDEKWGVQRRPDGTGEAIDKIRANIARQACDVQEESGGTATWYAILLEEAYEALAESDVVELRKELVQVIAVCGAWIEDIDAREKNEDEDDSNHEAAAA